MAGFLYRKLSSFQIICLGFMGVILVGALLLMLPAAARGPEAASWEDALFTAVSAVCVTGLVVRDTALFWSPFGQAVILILIQIGGLGVVSVAAFLALIFGKRIGLQQRSLLQDTISAHQIGGKVLTHTYITQNIWGRSWENDVASLRVFMVTLRKKLESAPDSPQYIQTHIGIGYRMLKVE